jgi:hypothetical protein
MIFSHLTRHLAARRPAYSLSSRLLCVARSLRVLAFYREHRALCALGIVRDHVAGPGNDDVFHHLSHRDYLARGLSLRQRVRAVLNHYRFEDETFDSAYGRAVYGQRCLLLWRHEADGNRFLIQLEMASRANAEGDLTVALIADGICLHRLSFSWVEGAMVGVADPVVPFITRNQGRWIDSGAAFDAFERVFPNNSPSFFCFAAMQGLAQAAGMDKLVAVRSEAQLAYDADPAKHFTNAYDGFWKVLGGVDMPGQLGYLIALPFYVKPLSEMPSKHRKRAAQRREHWRAIGEAARASLERHLLHPGVHAPRGEAFQTSAPAAMPSGAEPAQALSADGAHLAH